MTQTENTLCIKAAIGNEYTGFGPILSYRWTEKTPPNKSDIVYVSTPHGEATAIVHDVYVAFPTEVRRLRTVHKFE